MCSIALALEVPAGAKRCDWVAMCVCQRCEDFAVRMSKTLSMPTHHWVITCFWWISIIWLHYSEGESQKSQKINEFQISKSTWYHYGVSQKQQFLQRKNGQVWRPRISLGFPYAATKLFLTRNILDFDHLGTYLDESWWERASPNFSAQLHFHIVNENRPEM